MSNPDPSTPCAWSLQRFELRDHELAPDESERLRAHLAACPHCRQENAWDDHLIRLLRQPPLPPPPTRIAARVRLRLARRRLVRAGGAVAAALALAFGLSGGQPEPPRHELPTRVRHAPQAGGGAQDIPGSPVLFAGPPVDPLDVLSRQQSAYLAVLAHPEE
jgi:anti-sigma factor RsiW